MLDPRKPSHFTRLVSTVKSSYEKLGPFRTKRSDLLKAFVGSDYTTDGAAKKVYLYLLTMATNIYVRQLAIRAPTAQITSPFAALRPMAKNLSLACAEAAQETNFGVTLRRAVTDALYSPMSVVKIGLEYVGKQEYSGEQVDSTKPFVRKVSFDDYVRDMSPRSALEPAFEGDKYYLDRDVLERRYPEAMRALKLSPDDLGMLEEGGTERAEDLSHGGTPGDDDIRSRLAVWDIWLPEQRSLVTYLANKPDRPLDVIAFDSLDEGPYRHLWYTPVPDNAMPLPPFSILRNIHELANSLFRRVASQAQKQKRVAGFSDEESAIRFSKAHDGDGVHWDGQKPEMITVGGIDRENLALLIQVKDMFSWTAGNMDTLGGLSPMADTATQEGMMSNAAGAAMADMQDATSEFARSVFRQIAWYEWTDPIRERVLQKEIPGTSDYIPVEWSPETRQGDFLDFNFNINPHSMREDNPTTKVQKLKGVLNEFYAPLMPFFQMQGLTIDVRRLNHMIGDYVNLPELDELIVAVDPSMAQQQGGPEGDPMPKPAQTTRRYERINRPGATRVGKDMALTQTLLGGGIQPSEAAAAGRPVG
jgi:hypothetical protein